MSDQILSSTLGQEGASVAVHYNSNSTQAAAEDTVMAIKAAGSDAFAVESAESIAYHKSQSMKRRLTEDPGYRSHCKISCHRGLVDYRADTLCQRRLHDPVEHYTSLGAVAEGSQAPGIQIPHKRERLCHQQSHIPPGALPATACFEPGDEENTAR